MLSGFSYANDANKLYDTETGFLKKYSLLRIRQFSLLRDLVGEESNEKIAELEEVNKQIDEMLE